MRYITLPISEILDVVNCAETYGFQDDVLFDAFASWVGREVTDAEISAYASKYMTPEKQAQGYGPEDHDGAIRRLTEWRDQYCKGAK